MKKNISKHEAMRTDPKNWKWGIIYYCPEDPRMIVRQRLPIGWTWNFAHPKVYLGILVAASSFLAPPFIAWSLGVRSGFILGLTAAIALVAIMYVANRVSQDPKT